MFKKWGWEAKLKVSKLEAEAFGFQKLNLAGREARLTAGSVRVPPVGAGWEGFSWPLKLALLENI